MGVCVTLANITWRKRSAVLIALTSQRAIKLDTKIFMCQIEWVNNADGVLCKLWDFIYLKHNISTFFLSAIASFLPRSQDNKTIISEGIWTENECLYSDTGTMWLKLYMRLMLKTTRSCWRLTTNRCVCAVTSSARFHHCPSFFWSSIIK